MLEIKGVEKTLENFMLQDVNIKLPKGYIMGVIGENRAGKTTLLNLILGLYRPAKGQIIIDGMTYETQEKEIRNLLGYVLVDEVFFGEMKLINQADMYGKYYGKYDRTLFLDYCKRFQLDEKKKYKKLSKGEKLKFQFAFALAHKPKLLILDEPTANFDPEFREQFLKIITEFVANGENSVLLATHIMEDIDRIADYVTFLHKGKVKFCADRRELENNYRLVSGEEYKINLISKERVIHKEKGKYAVTALVKHTRHSYYSKDLEVDVPGIEDIMYHIIKSEKAGEKYNDKRCKE